MRRYGWIPDYPDFRDYSEENEKIVGGHAVKAIGYDDDAGAVLIRNSWGSG